jgi:hypothetical protein
VCEDFLSKLDEVAVVVLVEVTMFERNWDDRMSECPALAARSVLSSLAASRA